MSGWIFRKYLSILFKTRFGVSLPVTGWRVVVFIFAFIIKKKEKSLWLGRTRAYIKRIIKVSWIFFNFSCWGESVNRNSIIMISKGYHYVINLGIVSNFCISIDPVYPGSLPKDLSYQVNSGESGFSLPHRSSSSLSMMSFDRA